MAHLLRYDEGRVNPQLAVPVQISVELMNALGNNEVILAAISYASKWLAQSLRNGEQFTVYKCKNVLIIATLEEDETGWYVQIDPCEAQTFMRERKSCRHGQ